MFSRQPTHSFSTFPQTFWIHLISMTGLFCFDEASIVLIPLIRVYHFTTELINTLFKFIEEDPDKSSMKEAENISFYR